MAAFDAAALLLLGAYARTLKLSYRQSGSPVENRLLGPVRGFFRITQRVPVVRSFVVVVLTGEHFGLVRLPFFTVNFFGGNRSRVGFFVRRRSVFCFRYHHEETQFPVIAFKLF